MGFIAGSILMLVYYIIFYRAVQISKKSNDIFGIMLSIGFGLQKVPMAMQHLDGTLKLLMTSGLLPAAIIAVVLNLVLPKE